MERKQKKILVVDDDPDILEFLRELLTDEGYIAVITDKAEYLEKLHYDALPDLFLVDVLLSGKDGREIVKHLKGQGQTKHIPVIMFSAHPSAEETTRAAGANDFLAKPFEIDDLLTRIEKYI
jgi:CheY-like chemotaxis protein